MILTAIVAVVAVVALVVQGRLGRRDTRSAVTLERARQDLLLNRLASRTLGEYVAASQQMGVPEIVAPQAPPNAPRVRYLYDSTGLTRVEVPIEEDDEVAV